MLAKDKTYTRDVNMMEKHPHLQPKMRAILLDWLMEVGDMAINVFNTVGEGTHTHNTTTKNTTSLCGSACSH